MLPNSVAEQCCRAVLPSNAAEQCCRAVLPSGVAEQCCRAVLPCNAAERHCRATNVVQHAFCIITNNAIVWGRNHWPGSALHIRKRPRRRVALVTTVAWRFSECEGLPLRGVCSCKANPVHGVFAAKWQMDGTAGPLVAEQHAPLRTKIGK